MPQLPLPATSTAHSTRNGWLRFRFGSAKASYDKESALPTPEAPSVVGDRTALDINQTEIEELLNIHKCFKLPLLAPDVEVTDLPCFDDLVPYGVSEEAQKRLWSKEVSRLVEGVSGGVPQFRGSKDFSVDSRRSYDILADLADQFWHALNIIMHDDQNILAEHAKFLCLSERLKRSRKVLEYFCEKEEKEKTDSGKTAEVAHGNTEDYFAFVNYLTTVLARVVCGSLEGSYLKHQYLARLAQVSAKLKVLSTKLLEFAEVSISNGIDEHMIPIPNQEMKRGREDKTSAAPNSDQSMPRNQPMSRESDLILERLRPSVSGQLDQVEPIAKRESLRQIYYNNCSKSRIHIIGAMRTLSFHLRGTSDLTLASVTSYELCAVVYETGFEKFRTLVYQDRDNDLSGISDATYINYAQSAFYLLDQVANNIQSQVTSEESPLKNRPIAGPDTTEESIGTRLSWSSTFEGDGSCRVPNSKRLDLRSMSHVVSVMIPLLMASPGAAHILEDFITTSIYTQFPTERLKNMIKPKIHGTYSASFSLGTREHYQAQQQTGQKSLGNAPMGRNSLMTGKNIAQIGRTNTSSSIQDDGTDQDRQRHQVELDRHIEKMKQWVMMGNGVMVKCEWFVLIVAILCAFCVFGGVAVGFSVGHRLAGVDPFNITTYCWVVGAFLIVVAKSIRVKNWPWNDFLHGRVLCTSVSELSSVTGINEQVILAKLLQDESVSVLQTRGPYNAVFRRKKEDGFSIDRPLSLWTMLLSGLIMVDVETQRGQGVVCLDLRRGTELDYIVRSGEFDPRGETEFIYCDRRSEDTNSSRMRLEIGSTSWIRTLGFHCNDDTEFI